MPHFIDGELREESLPQEETSGMQPQVGSQIYNPNMVEFEDLYPQGQMSIPPPVQQGWQCPVCFRVMSPSMSTCAFHHGRSFENANLRMEMPRLQDAAGSLSESRCPAPGVPGMRDPNETDHSARRIQDQRDDRI